MVEILYHSSPEGSSEEQQALHIIWQLVNKEDIPVKQRLSVAIIPLALPEHNYADRAEAVRMVCTLIQGEEAKAFLSEKWGRMYDEAFLPDLDDDDKVSIADIPSMFELASQDVVPTKIRDEMYQSLLGMVPRFRDLKVARE